eukprot:CAMPEP_0196772550 /NCGR_PEP_ID=MMETSP1104-20130614/2293_1 /TAXON_ID=33652 /ORGANISM="Cafeteria sp., Strain Caron Lab Isolate" /LENGTH=119 /DNA_ID=CAMNT_0042142689 /DNA_START=156 /DNA_END=512 /DNA_ORIENTATION=-
MTKGGDCEGDNDGDEEADGRRSPILLAHDLELPPWPKQEEGASEQDEDGERVEDGKVRHVWNADQSNDRQNRHQRANAEADHESIQPLLPRQATAIADLEGIVRAARGAEETARLVHFG